MLPRYQRLNRPTTRLVVKRGYSLRGPSLRVKSLPTRGLVSRGTVVVPIAFDKRAVRRNRIKRQVREVLKSSLEKFNPPLNLVVFVSKEATNKVFKEIKDELIMLLKRIQTTYSR